MRVGCIGVLWGINAKACTYSWICPGKWGWRETRNGEGKHLGIGLGHKPEMDLVGRDMRWRMIMKRN
ncbi:unnamed protein product [Sphenostylis stenocarpa]|uniref:Uncharacterized protein n=1 Tax=Sphenostylis stenocarpa TaxID=92480 RepID=A0AA86SIQ9_9FABA|nr:unnamed protein product [Sphenostylis stenocarpa]